MKNKFIFLTVILTALWTGAVRGSESAENSAPQPSAPADAAPSPLQMKLDQARSYLSELDELIKQREQAISDVEGRARKSGVSRTKELDQAIEAAKREMAKLREELKSLEKDLPARAKKIGDCARIRSELEKTRKERLDDEGKVQEAQARLLALQNGVSDLKAKIAETGRQAEEKEKQAKDLESAQAELERERSLRTEALARAEQAVAASEKTEKERLLLQSRLAELEQKIWSARQNLSGQSKLSEELENEKKTVREVEEKIGKEEKARALAEKDIDEIKAKIDRYEKMIQAGSRKDEEIRLQSELAKAGKQRADAEANLRQASLSLQERENLLVSLSNRLSAITQQESARIPAQKTKLENDLAAEKNLLAEAERNSAAAEKRLDACEKNIEELKKQADEGEKRLRSAASSGNEEKELRSQIENLQKERSNAGLRIKEIEGKLQEKQKAVSALADTIGENLKRQEAEKGKMESIAALSGEVGRENALLKEVAAHLQAKESELKIAEENAQKSEEQLARLQAQAAKDEAISGKLDAIRAHLAEQKKLRAQIETGLQAANKKQEGLENNAAHLKSELDAAREKVKLQEAEMKALDSANSELARERTLAREATDKLAASEQAVQRLTEEQNGMQSKLAALEEQTALRKKQLESLEQARSLAAETKKSRLAAEKEYAGSAQAEKELAARNNDLQKKLRAAGKEQAALSEKKIVVEKGAKPDDVKYSGDEAEDSSSDPLAAEQAVLARARGSEQTSGVQDAGAAKSQKTSRQSARSRINEAEAHYAAAIQQWDNDDIEGAIAEFKETVRLNPDAAGAYYNIALGYARLGNKQEACKYAYQAGECYLRLGDNMQATRMSVLMSKIDQNTPYLAKLRNKIGSK